MYYVQLEMKMPDGTLVHLGTSATDDFDKMVSQFKAFREVVELFVCGAYVVSYELRLGTIPSALQ